MASLPPSLLGDFYFLSKGHWLRAEEPGVGGEQVSKPLQGTRAFWALPVSSDEHRVLEEAQPMIAEPPLAIG